jgi:hypothetical protein
MGHKVILTPQSLEDLEGIVTFIASNNSERSRTFGDELIDRALSTPIFPNWAGWCRKLACRPSAKSFTAHTGSFTKFFPTGEPFMSYAFGMVPEASRK